MRINVDEHAEALNDIEQIELRNHIGAAYQLAESLPWCNPNMNFDVHKRTVSSSAERGPREAIVPVISATFMKHDAARQAYTDIQNQSIDSGLEVYDVRYDKNKMSIGVVLEPFELE